MPSNTNNPVNGQPAQQATGARINDLQPIADQDISLSMNFEVDLPNETFRASFLQVVDYIKREVLNSTYLVGDIIETTNEQTPQDRGLTGTWERVEPDISTRTVASGDPNLGTVTGNNDPVVPVPLHGHTNTANSIVSDPGHDHSETYGTGSGKDATGSGSFHGPTRTGSNTTGITVDTTVSIDQAGTENATLDVRGKRLNVIKWIKTAN